MQDKPSVHVGPGEPFRYKRELIAVLRALRLLPLAERLYAERKVHSAEEENAAFAGQHPELTFPPARLIQRTYGIPSLKSFHYWGLNNAKAIGEVIDAVTDQEKPRVLEWGCGLGRIGRHLMERYDYTGVDIDHRSIGWCAQNLDGRFTVNKPNPPLPFPNESWDVVFAVSIFTHLSAQAHEAWRDEILRVLKPGGVFIFTVHGEEQARDLAPSERAKFDAGKIVVRGGVPEGSRTYLAYHPDAFVKTTLLEPFETVRGPEIACNQTLYVGRKPL
ncbi:MAG: class I SAM-dependent methyltransferase [Pseudomonadota bacterium]